MNHLGKILIIFVLLALPSRAWGQAASADEAGLPLPGRASQASEVGLPFPSEHFAPQEYRQYPQNWAITQDHRGLIYVANNDGILEHDGESWRLIPTVTNTFVRSLTTSDTGTVYAGVVGDFGYLEPDSVGVMRYVSLFDEIPVEHQSFKDVWGTHATSEGVYFQANEHLFRWDGTDMEVWASEQGERGMHTSFVVRDELYVRKFEEGLLKMEDDSLQRVPGGERFAGTPVHMMVPFPDDRVLIGTSKDGLYLYDGHSITPFTTEAQPFLDEYELYHGSVLPNGHVALATIGGGVLVIDRQGQLVRVLGSSSELPDGVVHYVYGDQEGGLWMAFNSSGVARAEVVSPLSLYDDQLGLEGLIYRIEKHQDRLYVATGSGLFVLEEEPLTLRASQPDRRTSFRRIDEIPNSWDIRSAEDGLLVATERGMFFLQGEDAERLTRGGRHTARTVVSSDQFEGWFFVGGRQGLTLLHREADTWDVNVVSGIDEEIHSIAEGLEGRLWLGTAQGDVLRLSFPTGPNSPPSIERFQSDEGLPAGFNRVISIGEEVFILSKKGVFSVEEHADPRETEHDRERSDVDFVQDDRFRIEQEQDPLLSLAKDSHDNLWMLRGDRAYHGVRKSDSSYNWSEVKDLHFPKAEMNPLHVDENGVLWVGVGRELIRYDARQTKQHERPFPVHIRQITALRNRNVLYGGATAGSDGNTTQRLLTQIDHENNDLRFDFATTRFGNTAPIEYQYRLEGIDSGWSDWQAGTNAVYSDLTEGNYVFRVRAREGPDRLSQEASLRIDVLPPWYRTWWAYAAYLTALVLTGLGYRRYHRIVEENERAKEQAKELERERLANERLHEANQRLKQANELKDNFLANTSHELRTPLTTILGFTDVLKEEAPAHHQEFLSIIEKSGHRLLRTLNALLDLAKLRSGVVETQLSRVDVVAKAEELFALFQRDARRKGIRLELVTAEQPIYARLDARYYEQILDNLLSNAVKFTDEGGVMVEIEQDDEWVYLHVRDTGVGINEAFVPYLFDDFKQESSGLDRDHEGNGLGLAITSRLVELLHGTIDVESAKGVGSTFTVSFPRFTESPQAAPSKAEAARSKQHS